MTNERRYSICHNDDDRRDPKHRRVMLRCYKQRGTWWLESTSGQGHTDMGRNLRELGENIRYLYGGSCWDLRSEP